MKLQNLETEFLGQQLIFFDEIDSTQLEIKRMISSQTIANGLTIVANHQTSGLGTHGRRWKDNSDGNLMFSFYYDLNCNIDTLDGLTKNIAELIIDIAREKYQINLDLKLPNDIYCNGKKLGGILTEVKSQGNVAKYLIVGIGLNTNNEVFDDEVNAVASSIKNEFGINIDNYEFLATFFNKMEHEIKRRICL